ncbi:MAG: hypothetical protein KJ899_06115 [Gammaproteobacteria bacterium]|nr:hypothetical protein [Gammaproteobacteria bacterium]
MWFFDVSIGQRTTRITWNVEFLDGTHLTDPQYEVLLDHLKRFAWSMFVDRRKVLGRGSVQSLSAGSASKISQGISFLSKWMTENKYTSFDQLTNDASNDFLESLLDDLSTRIDGEGDPITYCSGVITDRIRIITDLWAQTPSLKEAGIPVLPEQPFDGRSAKSIADEAATKAFLRIPPLPDEVALPIMNAAHRMIWEPADDVINLVKQYFDGYGRGPDRKNRNGENEFSELSRKRHARTMILDATFTTIKGENEPWHVPLHNELRSTTNGRYGIIDVLGSLVKSTSAACEIVLQSESGIRISEMPGIMAGMNSSTGLPNCIEVRKSKTGLNELFYIKSLLIKTREVPEELEWLIGSRPVGSDCIPAPVRAVQVLQALLDPYRRLSSQSVAQYLIVNGPQRGLPRSSVSVNSPLTATLSEYQKNFIEKYVDLSNLPNRSSRGEDLVKYKSSLGRCVRPHQWRKNFALYVYRTDSRMIPAIAQQFKHLSLAMTEQSYIGNDATLLDDFNSVRRQETTRFFVETSRGNRLVTGRMADVIDRHRDEINDLISNMSERDAHHAIDRWCIENDLRIWYADHGKCFGGLNPTKMRCNELGETLSWLNDMPNYQVREPGICIGCASYAIDHEHFEYHKQRYIKNQRAWLRAKEQGMESQYRVARERAKQAQAVLRVLKIDLPEVKANDAE